MEYREYKYIPGYEGRYKCDRVGNIISTANRWGKDKPLKPYIRKKGRSTNGRARFVKLTDAFGREKEVKASRAVWTAWYGEIPKGAAVVHINGDLNDNALINLRLASAKEIGKMTGAQSNRKPVAKIDRNGEEVEVYTSAREAARKNAASYQTILDRCNGKVKNEYELFAGYTFRFAE